MLFPLKIKMLSKQPSTQGTSQNKNKFLQRRQKNTITKLPPELLHLIADHCDEPKTAHALSRCNKQLHSHIVPHLNKRIREKKAQIAIKTFLRAYRCPPTPQPTDLSLAQNTIKDDGTYVETLSCRNQLQSSCLHSDHHGPEKQNQAVAYHFILSSCPNIKNLNLAENFLDRQDLHLLLVAPDLSNLTALNISHCKKIPIDFLDALLKKEINKLKTFICNNTLIYTNYSENNTLTNFIGAQKSLQHLEVSIETLQQFRNPFVASPIEFELANFFDTGHPNICTMALGLFGANQYVRNFFSTADLHMFPKLTTFRLWFHALDRPPLTR